MHRQAQYGLETARSGVRHGGFEQIVGDIAAAYHRADDIADDFARLVAGGDKTVGDGGDTAAVVSEVTGSLTIQVLFDRLLINHLIQLQ